MIEDTPAKIRVTATDDPHPAHRRIGARISEPETGRID